MTASTPRFDRFLEEVFEGDRDTIAYLMRFLGYCMTGHTSERTALMLLGPSFTGKSTLRRIVCGVMGTYATTLKHTALTRPDSPDGRLHLQHLKPARLAVLTMPPDGLQPDILGKIIDGEEITARHWRRPAFQMRPTAKLLFDCIRFPKGLRDMQDGRSRLAIVPFRRVLAIADVEPALHERILAEEGPEITARLLVQSRKWFEDEARTTVSGLLSPSAAMLAASRRHFPDEPFEPPF